MCTAYWAAPARSANDFADVRIIWIETKQNKNECWTIFDRNIHINWKNLGPNAKPKKKSGDSRPQDTMCSAHNHWQCTTDIKNRSAPLTHYTKFLCSTLADWVTAQFPPTSAVIKSTTAKVQWKKNALSSQQLWFIWNKSNRECSYSISTVCVWYPQDFSLPGILLHHQQTEYKTNKKCMIN